MKLSIITPVYNGEKTIEKTIMSILAQNYDGLEYIIVDGGSTDGTLEIIKKYEAFISNIISEKDEGIADAYNKGVKLAGGELIGIIASDDQLTRGALKALAEQYDACSDVVSGSLIRKNQRRCKLVKSDKNLEQLRTHTSLAHPTTFIRKDAYEKYGLYSLKYHCAMDRELLLRYFVSGASFQIIEYPLTIFNVGGISTYNPVKSAYPEDRQISIEYGMGKIHAGILFWKAVSHFYICKGLKGIMANIPAFRFFYQKYNNSKVFMREEEIMYFVNEWNGDNDEGCLSDYNF